MEVEVTSTYVYVCIFEFLFSLSFNEEFIWLTSNISNIANFNHYTQARHAYNFKYISV